jgi:hypothetical protein
MSKVEVNEIDKQNGSTLTIGGSGTTVQLGTGATQTGFGRTGTVDWQTGSIKTSTFTAANGEGYFANTSGGAFTMNLPAGTAGNIVAVVDYTNSFQTHNLTIAPNGSQKIGGVAATFVARTEGLSVTFVYVDDTEGWKLINDATSNSIGASFICASVSGSGNTLATAPDCADTKIATFTGPGTFTVNSASTLADNNIVSYMLIAGGGGGGGDGPSCSTNGPGGGGAGGFRELKSPLTPYTTSPLDGYATPGNRVTVSAQAYPIVVGGGGGGGTQPGAATNRIGQNGANTTALGLTAAGGGGGASGSQNNNPNAVPCAAINIGIAGRLLTGGSGGGAGWTDQPSPKWAGGVGNNPPTTPPQGQNGGAFTGPGSSGGGGGGGAGAVGSNNPNPGGNGGPGGAGVTSSISANPVAYAGGGGGGRWSTPGTPASGGSGGGGAGGVNAPGTNGTDNTGGGGGGNRCGADGGTGGSGIVIIRYKFQ